MRERSFRWLCSAAACAAVMFCAGVPILAADTAPAASVNLDLKDTDVRSAVEALFRGTGKNYSIDSNVQGTISALSIKDVPFDAALRSLTKSAGLVFRQDAGVYIISTKPDVNPNAAVASSMPTEVASIDTTTSEPEIKIEKVPLNNVSASEILSILNGNQNRSYGGYGMMGYGGGGYGGGSYGGGYGGYGGGSGYGGGYGGYGGGYGGYGGRSGYSGGYGGYGGGYGVYSGGRSGYSGGYGGGYGGGGYRSW